MKKKNMLQTLGLVICGVIMMGATVSADTLHVDSHSKDEIIAYMKSTNASINHSTVYQVAPTLTAPYAAGKIDSATRNAGLVRMNQYRYIAGLPTVSLDDSYCDVAQKASLINALNGDLSHSPSCPAGMETSFYNECKAAAGSVNLAAGYSSLPKAVDGWVDEEGILGHRRWIFNPPMKKTGFGVVNARYGTYTAMYAFDNWYADTDYSNVAWPARYTPVEMFHANEVWSVSTGNSEDASKITVKVVRKSDNKVWTFKNGSGLAVDNENYGLTGCVMFTPSGITSISNGDVYTVTITGLVNGTLTYNVEFFSDASCYTVKFDGNLASSGSMSDMTSCEIGKEYKLNANTFKKKGYTFAGWNTKKDGSGTDYVNEASVKNLSKTRNAVVTLYAKWEKVTVSKIKKPSLKNTKSKTMKITYKKLSSVKGYEIRYATKSNMKSAKMVFLNSSASSKTIKKLKKGKTYYIQVRAYKLDSMGEKVYSSWSAKGKVKIKK